MPPFFILPAAAMKALIVAPSWIGDAVLAQPLLMRLRERDPGLELHALAPAWVAPVLERMPEISRVIGSPFAHGELALSRRWALARKLAREGYARAYILPNSFKSALVPFFAEIPERIGFTGEARAGIVNRRHTLDKKRLPRMVERFAALAETPGTLPPASPPLSPHLLSTPQQQENTLAALGLARPARLAALCPGAEYGPAKRWPARHFAALAHELSARGYAVLLLGSASDAAIGAEIAGEGDALNFCGATSLAQAIDLLALADLVVCNDSGLMHIAAALGRKLVALYGSSSPGFTPPLSENAVVLSLGLPCSPCFERTCPLVHLDCLEKLPVQYVLERSLQ